MNNNNWFRNTDWSDEIAFSFETKLKRARDKQQYLRIQACTLADRKPEIALQLLDRYFALGDHFDWAQAYVDQANAYLNQGNLPYALDSLDCALKRESERPSLKTTAYTKFPFLVAVNKVASRYAAAQTILAERSGDIMFPIDRFKWHTANALICFALGDISVARDHAQKALNSTQEKHSGFKYHPSIGLVGMGLDEIKQQLNSILSA